MLKIVVFNIFFLIPCLYCMQVIQKKVRIEYMIHSSLFMKIKQLKLVIVLLIDWFVVIQWPLSLDVLMETNFKDSSIQAIVSKGFMLSNTFELT